MRGKFDASGFPYIEIEVKGAGSPKKLSAIIDTGYNGTVSLPFVEAFDIGLVLKGVEPNKLGDGSSTRSFVCIGDVMVDGKNAEMALNVQEGGPILVGTGALKILGKKVVADPVSEYVEICDSSSAPGTIQFDS